MYIQDPKLLGIFISDVRASSFRASGGLEPSKIAFGRAGGPRFRLDTSLAGSMAVERREAGLYYSLYIHY